MCSVECVFVCFECVRSVFCYFWIAGQNLAHERHQRHEKEGGNILGIRIEGRERIIRQTARQELNRGWVRLFPAVTGVTQSAMSAVSQVATLRGRGVERKLHVSGRLSWYRRLRRLATCDTADMAVCATQRWLTARKNRTPANGPELTRSNDLDKLVPWRAGFFSIFNLFMVEILTEGVGHRMSHT